RANPAVPLALRARLRDDAPIPGTRGTGRHRYELPEHGACGPPHLARATAGAAGRGARARRGTAAAALGAPLVGAHLDLLGGTARHLGEIELEGHLQVLAAVLLAAAPAPASKKRIEAAQPAEVAHEHVERFGQVEVREPEVAPAPSTPAAQTGGTIAIVAGALLRVPQDLVRLGDLLELRFGRLFFVRTHAIGMVLHREATVGLFDLGFVRVALDAEQRVVVVRHSSNSPTRRLVCSTRATILSYGMRVGPMTPMTPASAPSRYEAVTSVKQASLASWCSVPIVIVSPWPSRWASASRNKSRRSVTSMSPCNRSLVANSGWPARSCALPSTTPTPAFPAVGISNSSSASWMKMLRSSLESASGVASRNRSGSVPRISRNVSPASRSFNTTPTWATASGASRAGTSTKIERTTPLLRVSTNNSRSDDACNSSSRSSTAASSVGPTATPSSLVSTPSTCAARSRIWSTTLCSPSPSRIWCDSDAETAGSRINEFTYTR